MTESDPILIGPKAIAKYLNLTERQVRWLDQNRRIPTFRIGRRIAARVSTIQAWFTEQEQKRRAEAGKPR